MEQSFQIVCPACFASLKIKDRAMIGRTAKCPKCDTAVEIEDPDQQEVYGISSEKPEEEDVLADAAELETFRDAQGPETDALFLALMSDHHAGGVAMAQDAASRAEDAWVVDTAERMARIQASEIAEMEFAREAAGLPSSPAGFVADFGPDAADMGEMDMDPSQSDMDNDDGG